MTVDHARLLDLIDGHIEARNSSEETRELSAALAASSAAVTGEASLLLETVKSVS